MLKKPLAAALVLSFCLLATPVTAQAGTWTNTPRINAPNFFSDTLVILASWWGSLLGAESEAPVLEKNGCGIDPNGQPLCTPWIEAMPGGEPGSGN